MPNPDAYTLASERVLIRLDTLIRLRWFAIIGQAGAVLVIAFAFDFPMPWAVCLALIAVSAALNVFLARHYQLSHRMEGDSVFALLAFDLAQLGILLALTGGLQNPFAILLMAPVIVSATSLKRNHTLGLGIFAILIITFLAFRHMPLPWDRAAPLVMPGKLITGIWVALVCTLGFTAIYVFRVAEEARKLADALAATELVLQREQHLTALDGLAAAAAHELGTPLATIALVSKEMMHAMPADHPLHEDATLLRSQAQRCRDILGKLTSLSSQGETIIEQQTLSAMIEETVAPLRDFGMPIDVDMRGDRQTMPTIFRAPGLHFGLGNLIDNAVDFAASRVSVTVVWDAHIISVTVADDGPGFPPAIAHKLGEPFVSHRPTRDGQVRPRGMGLGLFIARTLLERAGAQVRLSNGDGTASGATGATIVARWPRAVLEVESATNTSLPELPPAASAAVLPSETANGSAR